MQIRNKYEREIIFYLLFFFFSKNWIHRANTFLILTFSIQGFFPFYPFLLFIALLFYGHRSGCSVPVYLVHAQHRTGRIKRIVASIILVSIRILMAGAIVTAEIIIVIFVHFDYILSGYRRSTTERRICKIVNHVLFKLTNCHNYCLTIY